MIKKIEEQKINIRPQRTIRVPNYLQDYDTSYLAMALSAETIIDNVPTTYDEAQSHPNKKEWNVAMKSEIESLYNNKAWTLVKKPPNKNIISTKWIFKIKKNGEGQIIKYKARLVARDFSQQEGLDYTETYSPVAKLITFRSLLVLAV